jgi:hypothetical protein
VSGGDRECHPVVSAPRYVLAKEEDRLVTRLLEHAFETIRRLPDAEQDALASVLLRLAGEERPPIRLTAEEERDLAEALAEAERGEFATEADMRALWTKYE